MAFSRCPCSTSAWHLRSRSSRTAGGSTARGRGALLPGELGRSAPAAGRGHRSTGGVAILAPGARGTATHDLRARAVATSGCAPSGRGTGGAAASPLQGSADLRPTLPASAPETRRFARAGLAALGLASVRSQLDRKRAPGRLRDFLFNPPCSAAGTARASTPRAFGCAGQIFSSGRQWQPCARHCQPANRTADVAAAGPQWQRTRLAVRHRTWLPCFAKARPCERGRSGAQRRRFAKCDATAPAWRCCSAATAAVTCRTQSTRTRA